MTLEGINPQHNTEPPRIALEISIPPDPREVPNVRRKAAQLCQQAGFTQDNCADLDLALGEALANAVVHARRPLPPASSSEAAAVRVCVWDYKAHLIVHIHDTGEGFNPPPPPYEMPPADTDATHGRGLPLMQSLTDAMIVARGDTREGGSSIFLVKAHGTP